jgi:hypothetical protein
MNSIQLPIYPLLFSIALCFLYTIGCGGSSTSTESDPTIPTEFLSQSEPSTSETTHYESTPSPFCDLANDLAPIITQLQTQTRSLEDMFIPDEYFDTYDQLIQQCKEQISIYQLPTTLTEYQTEQWDELESRILSLEESLDAGLVETLRNGIESMQDWLNQLQCTH